MSKQTKTVLPILLLVFLALISVASAQRFGGGRFDRGPDGKAPRFLLPIRVMQEVLELSDEQAAQLEALKEDFISSSTALRGQTRELRQAVREELRRQEPDAARIGDLVISIRDARNQLREGWKSTLQSVEGVLTEEQLETWKEFRQRRWNRQRGR